MDLIRHFKELSKGNVDIAGGKGASLGEMTQAGIPVPQGFVILSSAFDKFIEETDLNVEIDSILDRVNYQEMQSVENASEEINALILNAKMSKDLEKEIENNFKKLGAKFVAVRSSATSEDSSSAAWAGQLESYLNTTQVNLLGNVKKCWASLFTPRAIFYRKEQDLHKSKISVAVVVQKMVDSECSGIAFSVHPVTQDRNQVIIEAGLGLGETIVSGQITPDSYVIEKEPRRIIDKNISTQERGLYKSSKGGNEWKQISKEIGEKQVLSDNEILELTELIIRIEKHYGFPCDIEWARESGKFYIVQSRPITTLTDLQDNNIHKKSVITKKFSREHSLFYLENWSQAEIFHTEKIVRDHMSHLMYLAEPGNPQISSWYDYEEINRLFGLVAKKLETPNFFKWVEDEFHRLWSKIEPYIKKNIKVRSIEELKTFKQAVLDFYGPYTAVYVIPEIPQIKETYKKAALKLRTQVQDIVNDIDEVYLDFFLNKFPEYKEFVNYLTAEEIFSLQKSAFSDEKMEEILKRKETGFFLLNNKLYLYSELQNILEKNNLEMSDYTIKKKIFMKEHSREYSLFRLANWYTSMSKGLKNIVGYGMTEACGVYNRGELVSIYYESSDLKKLFNAISNRYTNKENIEKDINNYLNIFKKLKEYYKKEREVKSIQELKEIYEMYSIFWSYTAIMFIISELNINEQIKKMAYEARKQTQEYNESPEELFQSSLERFFPRLKGKTRFILPIEVWSKEINEKDFLNRVEGREKGFLYYKDNIYPGDIQDNLNNFNIQLVDDKSTISGNTDNKEREIKGTIAYPGKIKGIVKIVSKTADISKVQEGDILVTAMTMPKYLPAMHKAAAFVTDEGGITCHAAIISREMNKPCIIGTKVATQILKDGDLIEVDANNGIVRILEKLNKEKSIFDWWLSRQYPILQIETYNNYLKEIAEEVGTDITYPIFLYNPKTDLVTLYYNMAELIPAVNEIGRKITQDPKFRKKVFSRLIEVFEKIKPYFDGSQEIKSLEEFKEFFELFKDYMKYVAYTWILPGLDFVPEEIKEEAMKLRERTENYAGRRDSIMIDFADKIINNKKVNSAFLSLNEIKSIPKNAEKLTKERAKGFLFYKGEIIPAENINDFLDLNNFYLREPEVNNNSEVRGMIAQKGVVKGIAKIVYTEKELDKIAVGDILVTPMTRPEFIPAMHKAAAFVTDEGGIICHAAIVSREMKKPCIIGTKVATKVIHDGDLIEVDANNGIVKILKKS